MTGASLGHWFTATALDEAERLLRAACGGHLAKLAARVEAPRAMDAR